MLKPLLIFVLTALSACPVAALTVAPKLEFSSAEMDLARAVMREPVLATFYGENGLTRVFTGPAGDRRRDALRQALTIAPDHGIPLTRYRPEQLAAAGQDLGAELLYARVLARFVQDMTGGMIRPASADPLIRRNVLRPPTAGTMRKFAQSIDPTGFLTGLAPRNPAYLALQQALRRQREFLVSDNLPPVPEAVWRIGMRGGGVAPLRQRLASIGFPAEGAETGTYDEALSQAVARYQQAVGLHPDGVAGPHTIRRLNSGGDAQTRAILVALERLRWMGGEDLDRRMVWVNIPEFSARIIEGGHEVFQTRVVVGKNEKDFQTPEFSDQMEYVVVNPRWNVPRSITVKEYLPRLKANRYAVSHLDVIDGRGNVIARDRIDFGRYTAANFPYRMRQKPSEDNALGIVKFIFPNPWNIYLHDTPGKSLFGNRVRAYSHGCVRVGDPVDLATQLLSPQTSDPHGMFQRALDSGKERWLALKPNLPVHLVYFTAYPDQYGQIRYFDDIYGRDAAIWAKLQQAGLDSALQND
ncbi:L,D-transpeptidase family protein [Paracoccus sp. (in: a-proteobacteria)]|uniref:L,D-transpeptidase family protein n=1 Tax=Paracoccus sp. TaxID=267 RepID=UPI003A8C78EC